MKKVRRIFAAALFTFTLTAAAFAGQMDTPPAPTTSTIDGQMDTPPAPTYSTDGSSTSGTTLDATTDLIVTVVQALPTL